MGVYAGRGAVIVELAKSLWSRLLAPQLDIGTLVYAMQRMSYDLARVSIEMQIVETVLCGTLRPGLCLHLQDLHADGLKRDEAAIDAEAGAIPRTKLVRVWNVIDFVYCTTGTVSRSCLLVDCSVPCL